MLGIFQLPSTLFFCLAAWSFLGAQPLQTSKDKPDKARDYIEKYRHLAVLEMERSGIPASVKMAQALLESGLGQSELATKANNHFGIKCGGDWEGETYQAWDDEPQKSCFRVFPSVEASYVAHTAFLMNPKKTYRYGFLFDYPRSDYKAWAEGLQKAGYATSKTYAKSLISLIERYDLYKLDYLDTIQSNVDDSLLLALFPEYYLELGRDTQTVWVLVGKDTLSTWLPDPFGNVLDSVRVVLTRRVFEVNGLPAVQLHQGDNLLSLSKRYGISVKRLRRYNELDERVLRWGQHLFLKPKAKVYTGTEPFHLLLPGQTMYEVAQRYGLRYRALLKLNPKYQKQKPRVGDKLWLRKPNKAEQALEAGRF